MVTKTKSNAKARANGGGLVIVESPTKARTMQKFLGAEYKIKASMGHVRDLPQNRLAVDVEHNFEPQYEVTRHDVVKDIKGAFNAKTDVYLATDPDREGEAISWHLVECAGLKKANSVKRVVFHEITPSAVKEAFANPRDIDMNLVNAQQARRLLDRIVGYKVSNILWKKVRRGLSAGRVQSVALSLIVQREREIDAFEQKEYWNIFAHFEKDGSVFAAKLVLPPKKPIGDEKTANTTKAELAKATFEVAKVTAKEVKQRPAPPFTTSTLQQEASRRFGMNGRKTMSVAQQLYEGVKVGASSVGLITYMRTDSTNLSATALKDASDYIKAEFGTAYAGGSRKYKTKSANAQEAHEAIRPTQIKRTPDELKGKLSADQLKLYGMIWRRTVASQMKDAIAEETTIEIDATSGKKKHQLRAKGSVLKFDGFRKLYGTLQQTKNDDADDDEQTGELPAIKADEKLKLAKKGITADQKFTQPPPRYSEAMLIHAMEQHGIGRPSTYASIIHTIEQREYVEREKKRFKPTILGKAVCGFLEKNFPDIMEIKFTASMEADLDAISRGETEWIRTLSEFYEPFSAKLEDVSNVEHIHPSELNEVADEVCDLCGNSMLIKSSRHGKFLGCSTYPKCKNIKNLDGGKPREEPQEVDKHCEKCERPMVIKTGRYGRFLACSGYPECKNIEALIEKTGIKCPMCDDGELIRRESRRGPFYGCSSYPKCRFLISQKPIKDPCPDCGTLVYINDKTKKLVCYSTKKCGWNKPYKDMDETE